MKYIWGLHNLQCILVLDNDCSKDGRAVIEKFRKSVVLCKGRSITQDEESTLVLRRLRCPGILPNSGWAYCLQHLARGGVENQIFDSCTGCPYEEVSQRWLVYRSCEFTKTGELLVCFPVMAG